MGSLMLLKFHYCLYVFDLVLCVMAYKRSMVILMSKPFYGGARGVMVIVVGNGHGDTSSNPGQD